VTRRIVIAACGLLAVLWFGAAKADAVAEFCPAVVANVQSSGGAGLASEEYSYVLDAKTARTVDDAAIIADTDHGWYRWSVANVSLQMATLTFSFHNAGDGISYKYQMARSGRQLVAFPEALFVRHAWVTSARSDGETVMGWGKLGEFACEVPTFPNRGIDTAELERSQARKATPAPRKAPAAPIPAAVLPPLADGAIRAVPTSLPFDSIDCDTPFRELMVTDAISPTYPSILKGSVYTTTSSLITVAADEEGHVIDASLFASSGYGAFDVEAQRVARKSSYLGAISYCQKVKGEYIFTATYESR
jgi:hypothetical protein